MIKIKAEISVKVKWSDVWITGVQILKADNLKHAIQLRNEFLEKFTTTLEVESMGGYLMFPTEEQIEKNPNLSCTLLRPLDVQQVKVDFTELGPNV